MYEFNNIFIYQRIMMYHCTISHDHNEITQFIV